MSDYASRTTVSVDKTRGEIEALLRKHGATEFVYGWQEQRAVIGFAFGGRRYRFTLMLPDPNARRFTHTAHKDVWQQKERTESARQTAYDQAVRSAWRELLLLMKAKLIGVASGLVSVEDEFMAWAVTPSGQTVGEWLKPQLEDAARSGRMPPLLPGPRE